MRISTFSTLAFLLLTVQVMNGQEVLDVLTTGVSDPSGMYIDNHYLYYLEYTEAGTVSRIDLDLAEPEQEILVSDLWFPREVCVHEGYIYVMDLHLGQIWRINTLLEPNSREVIVNNLEAPTSPTFNGNSLYYTHYRWSTERSTIERITLDGFAVPDVVAGDFQYLSDIEHTANDVFYITEPEESTIYMLDMGQPEHELLEVNTEGIMTPDHLYSYEQERKLFISDFDLGEIFWIDIDEANDTPHLLLSGLAGPTGLSVYEGDLYFHQYELDKISKVSLDDVLSSTEEFTTSTVLPNIYPSPARDFVMIDDIPLQTPIRILNNMGQTVTEAVINPGEQISIRSLPAGNYFLQIEKFGVQQFIKL